MKKQQVIKWVTRGIALLFALLLILTSVLYVASAQESADVDYADIFGDGHILFVDEKGSEDNDGLTPETPLNSIQLAIDYMGVDGGTIVIVDYITLGEKGIAWPANEADGMQTVTLTGLDEESTLSWNRSLNPNGPVTIEYLNIVVDRAYAYLNARGHKLVLGYGLNVTKGEGVNCLMCIRGGGDTNFDVDGDTDVTVYSGAYSSFCGGSRNGYIHGDTHLTIYGGTFASVFGGNNNGSEEDAKNIKNVMGDSYITIYGGTFTGLRGHDVNSLVEGTRYLDVSHYPETINPAWLEHFDEIKPYDPTLANKKPEIKITSEGSFINGYTDGTFKPQNQITRAEAMTIVSRLLAKDEDIKGKYTVAYTDVAENAWYYSNVAYLSNLGVIDFLNLRNKVNPTRAITRQEVCQLIYNLGGIDSIKIPAKGFSDLGARTYNEAIYALSGAGIVNGYTDGTFKPMGTITRAEFVTIIDRFLGRTIVEANADAANKFNDISSHWAKNYIIAASSEKTVDGKEIWTVSKDAGKKFELSAEADTAEEYIKELNAAAQTLTTDAIQDGIQLVADKRIEEIRSTASIEIPEGVSVYYVSADGDDANDGLSPETPIKTLSKLNSLGIRIGSYVLFRRGDTFRGQIVTRSGVTYSAYGEGAKPNIYGWDKNSADPALWSKTDTPNVWVYAETVEQDVGNIIFNGEKHTRKVIRSEEKDGKKLDYRVNREFNDYHDLVDDLTFFHDIKGDKKVYLVCKAGNPGEVYDEIEMAKKVHIINNGSRNNVHIDNLCVKYGGAHGISAGNCKGLTVTNCEFAWIGGSLQTEIGAYNRTWPTPYGNAVEVYGEAVDYTIDNCYIWQVYDAGVTHQGNSSGNLAVSNVRYINNVIEKCVYAVEIFYGEAAEGSNLTRSMDGVYIENNLLRMGGGFGHEQRPDTGVTALIRNGGILNNTTNYKVTNNVFDRSKNRIITAGADGGSKAVYTDNLYVQKLDATYCTRYGKTFTASAGIKRDLEAFPEEIGGTFVLVPEYGY